jgi:hypothetical protein
LHTNQVSFEVLYKSALVGRAYVNPLDLLEGELGATLHFLARSHASPFLIGTNTLPTEFHYMVSDLIDRELSNADLQRSWQPSNPSDATAQDLLAQYLETKDQVSLSPLRSCYVKTLADPRPRLQIPLTIQGDSSSSPYGSLQPALSGVTLETSYAFEPSHQPLSFADVTNFAPDRFPGQGIPLVSDIVIYFDLVQGLCNSTVNIETRLDNNLKTYIQLLQLSGTASQNGVQYAEFDFTFTEDFTTGAGQNPGPYSRACFSFFHYNRTYWLFPWAEMITPVKLSAGPAASLTLLATQAEGLDIEITSRVSIGGYVAPSLQYSQKAVPYTIVPTAGGAVLDLGSIGSDPIGTLTGLVKSLTQITQCVGGVLTLLPGLGSSLLGNLPGFLTSLIQAPTAILSSAISDVSSVVSDVTSVAGSVVSEVTSVAGSVVSDVTSIVGDGTSLAGSLVSEATSVAGSVVGDITSALPVAATVVSEATSVVADVTSAAAAVPSAAESVVDQATSVVGGAACTLLPALCAGESSSNMVLSRRAKSWPFPLSSQLKAPLDVRPFLPLSARSKADSLHLTVARRDAEISPPTPTAQHPHGRPIPTATPVLDALVPPPSPTAAPLRPAPFDWLDYTAAQANADPRELQRVILEHGVKEVVEIGEWRRRRDERERLKKREA